MKRKLGPRSVNIETLEDRRLFSDVSSALSQAVLGAVEAISSQHAASLQTRSAGASIGPNVAPVTITPPANQSATENVSQSFSLGTLNDTTADEPYSMAVDWGDGSSLTTFSLAAPGTITPQSHTYMATGTDTVTVSAQDASADPAVSAQFTITVTAPAAITVTPPANTTATTGVSQSFALGSFTATNATSPYTANITWGDGTTSTVPNLSPGTIPAQSHTYASAGSDTISITVSDSASDTSPAATSGVTVSNPVVTTLTATAPTNQSATVNASQSFNLGSFTESNATAPYTVSVNWGDGSAVTTFPMTTAGTITAQSHTYTATGSKTVSVSVTDSASHTSNTATFTNTVSSTPVTPTLTATAPADQTSTVGETHSFALGSFTAVNTTAPYTVTVSWGDGSADTTFTAAAAGTLDAQSHTFAAAQVYTVHVTVTDSASHSSNAASFTATASAQPTPTLTVTAAANQIATTGQSHSFNLGSFVETAATGPYTVSVNWGDGSAATTFTTTTAGTLATQSHTYAGSAADTVSVVVTDSAGHTSNTATFTVTAVAASTAQITYTAPADQTATVGAAQAINLGSFVAANAATPFTATITWGDGTNSTVANLSPGTVPAQSHTYATASTRTVSVIITDSAGHSSTSQQFTVAVSSAGVPVKLAFTTQPLTVIAGVKMKTVVVTVEDGAGNVDASDNSIVTLTINGPAGSALDGTTSVTAVNGVATFNNLSIPQGGAFTLTAADGSDTPATSVAFAVNSSVLSPAVISSSLPTMVVAGQPTKGTILLNVTNTSATTQKGLVSFSVYASVDGVVDSSSTLLGTVAKKLSIRSGKFARVSIPIRVIPSSLLGTYPLVVEMTDSVNKTAQATTGSTVAVAAPYLSITAGLASLVKAEHGDTLTITNLGNVEDISQFTYTAGFSYDAAGTQPVGQTALLKTGILHIKAGKSVKVHINAWNKILGGLIYGNPYYLTIQISDSSNNTAAAVSASSFDLS